MVDDHIPAGAKLYQKRDVPYWWKFVKLQKYANFTPNDAEFDVRKQYNDVESDDMTQKPHWIEKSV